MYEAIVAETSKKAQEKEMVLDLVLVLLFLYEHGFQLKNLSFESFVHCAGQWRLWDLTQLRKGSMDEFKQAMFVDEEVRNEVIRSNISLTKTNPKELTLGVLCLEYLIGNEDEDLIEYLDTTPLDE